MTKVIADEKKSNGNSDVASADVKEKLPVESVEKESKCGAQPPPLDGGWGWMIVFAAFMVHVVSEFVTILFFLWGDEIFWGHYTRVFYFGEMRVKSRRVRLCEYVRMVFIYMCLTLR